jgi:hypothetical protein
MKTSPARDPLQTAQCIYSIPCECGRSYIGRSLAARLREYGHNLQQKKQNSTNMPMKRVIEKAGKLLGFWKLKVTVNIENARNRPIWRA